VGLTRVDRVGWCEPKKGKCLLYDGLGVRPEILKPENAHVISSELLVKPANLIGVASSMEVVGPPGLSVFDPRLFRSYGVFKGEGLPTLLETERPAGVRTVNRLAKRGNALGAGSVAPDLPCGRSAVQVPRGGLHAELVGVRLPKQKRVFVYIVGPPQCGRPSFTMPIKG
jgi:hypothetical protein